MSENIIEIMNTDVIIETDTPTYDLMIENLVVTDYTHCLNLPKINSVPVLGNKSSGEYGLASLEDISLKENISDKVVSIDENSTDVQYPSAKCVYDNLAVLADKNLSNLSVEGQAVIDGKVSKSGDTMTGALTVETAGSATGVTQDNCRVSIKNSLMEVSVTPSENLISLLSFEDKNGNELGNCYFRQQASGRTDINLNCKNPSGGSSQAVRLGYDEDNTAYFSFPNSTCVDGQWVFSNATICSSRNAETSDKDWNLSAYLPDDNYNYEVLLTGTSTTGTTSGNSNRLLIKSSIITSNCTLTACITRTSASTYVYGTSTFPIGADKILTVGGYASNTGTYNLYMRGYRRIGTNS